MNKKTKIILLLITLTAFFIRIYKTNSYPPLLWDETAIGYNAYSILKTGKDEYGEFLPLIFKSFGDYKPGFYIYLTVPFVAIFGLNPLSVRLPSIILGSLTPLFLYLLITQINPKNKKTRNLALISALILAFNPYNIHYSRGAWETNILTFQLILASYFFFKAITSENAVTRRGNIKKNNYFLLSSLAFSLSLYTYQSAKMISLFLIFILFSINLKTNVNAVTRRGKIQKNKNKFLKHFILPLFLLSLPIIYGLLFSSDTNRLKVLSLFSYPRSQQETETIISEGNKLDYQIFYNQPIFFLRNFLNRYFNHFSPKFLIFQGDWQNPRHSAPYIGVILYPSIIFLLIGIFHSLSFSTLSIFFLFWLLIAPIPASLTRDSIQATRTMSLSIPIVFFISLGLNSFLSFIHKSYFINLPAGRHGHKSIFFTFYFLLITVYFFSFFYYSDLYLNHMTKKSPQDFLYGYEESIQYLIKNQNKYDNIYFTDFYNQPYIYYLFYSKYPPLKYQQQAFLTKNQVGDTGKIEKLDNIIFHAPDFQFIKSQQNTLVIYSHQEIIRLGIDKSTDFSKLIQLSPINNISTFYAYQTSVIPTEVEGSHNLPK
ncbi:phospholipid carrier-dependent glycosyltransferase [Patescibacteria group bacterium]|nr:phospholipid carrier-dependent glycosyltransferase [Patescibacteria group bacterium]MCG2702073.1 phospholipid carrier-dependent glycosyltransferase [Candidatus Parcubacteria bacterium]MBU4265143.1 phospholipid carrier-dependent glycosyltransferase [Patescibacteria group bacterium]MBU4390707.1 phospholipid carrier-dependent glycosyltransferase [Patescibacteria group bacterium]MBU4396786.1 phospholipid carrier-dependent glycosyltransferase [Patescibacteria group bacterium]